MNFGEPSRVSSSQLAKLCELLETRKELALGTNRTRRGQQLHHEMWQEMSEVLNLYKDGKKKDGRGWCKYWSDYKCRLKKIAIRERIKQIEEGGSMDSSFSNIDIKFLDMIGEFDMQTGRWRNEFESKVADLQTNNDTRDTTTQMHSNDSNSDRSESPMEQSTFNDPGPSHTPKQEPPPAAPAPRPAAPAPRIIRRSPRLSKSVSISPPASPSPLRTIPEQARIFRVLAYPQRVKPEPPMNAEQALIVESQKQTRIQEKKLQLFRMLVSELREIKEILRTRSHADGEVDI